MVKTDPIEFGPSLMPRLRVWFSRRAERVSRISETVVHDLHELDDFAEPVDVILGHNLILDAVDAVSADDAERRQITR